MWNKVLVAGLLAATIIPGAASAQPYDPGCVRSNQDNRAAGTVLGAVGGALIGGAIAGRHDRGAGVVLGGVTGAVAGNAIAGSNNHPCPSGYYYSGDQGQYGPPPPPPGGGYGPPPPGPGYGPPPAGGDFWNGAPTSLRQRMDFMQDRIDHAARWLPPQDIDHDNRELNFIRSEYQRLRAQDYGHLRQVDRDYIQARLDSLSQRLHWERNYH